jgi:hypothetical protein
MINEIIEGMIPAVIKRRGNTNIVPPIIPFIIATTVIGADIISV